jgi:hypothetical protein
MKRSFLISALITAASSAFAQSQCNADNPLFKFSNGSTPTEVHTLGSAPEFPFIANLSSPRQVYSMIKKCQKNGTHKREIAKMNEMLMQIGFANGIDDLTPSSITKETLPSGTTGNMGSRGFTFAYTKLDGSRGFKSWKVSSGSGCAMYFMARCGNAFVPQVAERTACLTVPLTINSQPQEVTVNNTTTTTSNKIFVYYHEKRRKHRRNETWNANGQIPDSHPSRPLLLSTVDKANVTPETYKISVTSPDDHLKVCQDQQAQVSATINVEKSSEYTGNYMSASNNNNEYRRVSKRMYRRAERKMRRIERKERRIDRLTHVQVNV